MNTYTTKGTVIAPEVVLSVVEAGTQSPDVQANNRGEVRFILRNTGNVDAKISVSNTSVVGSQLDSGNPASFTQSNTNEVTISAGQQATYLVYIMGEDISAGSPNGTYEVSIDYDYIQA